MLRRARLQKNLRKLKGLKPMRMNKIFASLFCALFFSAGAIADDGFTERRDAADLEYRRGNDERAMEILRELINEGDDQAQLFFDEIERRTMLHMKATSAYQKDDFETSIRINKDLAALGDPIAQNTLGLIYYNGRGVDVDVDEAVKWFTMAINTGYPRAMTMLGVFYDKGTKLPEDDERAVELFVMAAAAGDKVGENMLQRLCSGETIPLNCP